MMMRRRPRPPKMSFLHDMVADCYHFSVDEEPPTPRQQMAGVCVEKIGGGPSSSAVVETADEEERPFRLIVRDQTFTIDSTKLRSLSPIFAIMCFGRDFENGRERTREIVDEKADDIAVFLRCIYDHSLINEWNFALLLRLGRKYVVNSLTDACSEYILNTNLDAIKPDQILTLLIAAHDHHLPKHVLKRLIVRLAQEDKSVHTRLRISRYLPGHLHAAVMSASINMLHIQAVAQQNGHFFKVDRGKTIFKPALCTHCKRISDAAKCDGCLLVICRDHAATKPCTSVYGSKMLHELRQNVGDFDWDEA